MPFQEALWALVTAILTVVPISEPIQTPDGRLLSAGLACTDGAAIYYRPEDASDSVDIHELAHAYDCMDDGELNGSPGHPRPETWRDARRLMVQHNLPFYCWFGGDPLLAGTLRLPKAEWYACMAEATRTLK